MTDLNEQETTQLIAARVRVKQAIKTLEAKKEFRTVAEQDELKKWRSLKRRLDVEIKKRIVQLPLL